MGGFEDISRGPTTKGDIFSCLLRVTPGFYILNDGQPDVVDVRVFDFNLSKDQVVSIAFELDGDEPGKPIFLHKKMSIKNIGTAEEILLKKEFKNFLSLISDSITGEDGLLLILNAYRMHEGGATPQEAIAMARNKQTSKLNLLMASRSGAV